MSVATRWIQVSHLAYLVRCEQADARGVRDRAGGTPLELLGRRGVSRLSTCRTGAAMIVSFVRRAQRDGLPRMSTRKAGHVA